jgi:hypothetical protein
MIYNSCNIPNLQSLIFTFASIFTTQGSVPPSLLYSPLGCTTSRHGPSVDQLGSLTDTAPGIPVATTFKICQFPQQFQPRCSYSPQLAQPKEVYPLLYTTVPRDVPLPSRAPTQGRIGSLRVVSLETPTMIMESPNLQIIAYVPLALHPLSPLCFF